MNISFFLKPKVDVSYLVDDCPVRQALEICRHDHRGRFPAPAAVPYPRAARPDDRRAGRAARAAPLGYH